MKPIANSMYAFFGIVFLVAGATVFLMPTGLLPDTVENIVLEIGQGDLRTMHIIQELSSLLIFAGLITFWFIRRYAQSRPFHWALTTFWGLFALAHWFDVKGSFHLGRGQIINTIPFVLFVLVGLLRKGLDRRGELRWES